MFFPNHNNNQSSSNAGQSQQGTSSFNATGDPSHTVQPHFINHSHPSHPMAAFQQQQQLAQQQQQQLPTSTFTPATNAMSRVGTPMGGVPSAGLQSANVASFPHFQAAPSSSIPTSLPPLQHQQQQQQQQQQAALTLAPAFNPMARVAPTMGSVCQAASPAAAPYTDPSAYNVQIPHHSQAPPALQQLRPPVARASSTPAPQLQQPRNVAPQNGVPYPTPESIASTPAASGAPSPLMLPGPQGQYLQQPQVGWPMAVGGSGASTPSMAAFNPSMQHAAFSSSAPQFPVHGMHFMPMQYQVAQGHHQAPNGTPVQYHTVMVPVDHQGVPLQQGQQMQYFPPQFVQNMQQGLPGVPGQPTQMASAQNRKRALEDGETSDPKRARTTAATPGAAGSSSVGDPAGAPAPRKRWRPRKVPAATTASSTPVASESPSVAALATQPAAFDAGQPAPVPKKRGRPRKNAAPTAPANFSSSGSIPGPSVMQKPSPCSFFDYFAKPKDCSLAENLANLRAAGYMPPKVSADQLKADSPPKVGITPTEVIEKMEKARIQQEVDVQPILDFLARLDAKRFSHLLEEELKRLERENGKK